MIRFTVIVPLVALLAACPQPTPVVPAPDASDASALGETTTPPPPPPAPSPTTPCGKACLAMVGAGCIVQPDCEAVLTQKTAARMLRNAKTGAPLVCADLQGVKTAADLIALGQPCGP